MFLDFSLENMGQTSATRIVETACAVLPCKFHPQPCTNVTGTVNPVPDCTAGTSPPLVTMMEMDTSLTCNYHSPVIILNLQNANLIIN